MKLIRIGRWCAVSAWAFSFTSAVAIAGNLAPLVVSSNHRYLQDSHGQPFFLVGDSPQNLPLKFPVSEVEGYMAECATRGFNLLWICVDGQTSDRALPDPPKDRQGRPMMRSGWDIGTLNADYFLTIDAILQAADRHGIYCMLTPLSECQWSQPNIDSNSSEKWERYGRFLGERYKDRPNIVWQFGNDKINVRAQHAIVRGLKLAGDSHLMTVNWRPGRFQTGSAWVRKHEHGESWIDLNAWYRNGPIRGGAAPAYWQRIEYERSPPMPSFQTEAAYQQPYLGEKDDTANATDLACRMQNYYVALGGGCGGQVYGAGWLAEKWDYAGYRDNGGRIQARHFKNLFAQREWWTLVPDYGHTFVTAGYGTLSPTTMDYVGAAIDTAGTLGLAYCPKATTITVDLGKFFAPVVARWFDPTNGRLHAAVEGSPLPNRGSLEFATPGTNIAGAADWVLVLETRPAERLSPTTANGPPPSRESNNRQLH